MRLRLFGPKLEELNGSVSLIGYRLLRVSAFDKECIDSHAQNFRSSFEEA